ncbi:hypothetical protein MNBD_GAMMA20-647 [hydrothermal vent metagenome]|uniref:Uncharacterized protein n=1 Tax=hydrothermal vent metagenome TaxID=652676 RepID=A0A3B1AM59_9ZZZZ
MRYLLRHSGYRLAEPEAAEPAMAALLDHLLPKVHRHLGPMTLQNMLSTLTGAAYQVVVDPMNPVRFRPGSGLPAHGQATE